MLENSFHWQTNKYKHHNININDNLIRKVTRPLAISGQQFWSNIFEVIFFLSSPSSNIFFVPNHFSTLVNTLQWKNKKERGWNIFFWILPKGNRGKNFFCVWMKEKNVWSLRKHFIERQMFLRVNHFWRNG